MKAKLIFTGILIAVTVIAIITHHNLLVPQNLKIIEDLDQESVTEQNAESSPKLKQQVKSLDEKGSMDYEQEEFHLHAVPNDQVCMNNNAFMGKRQTAIEINNKTYYACCGHCIERLKGDATSRFTRDPHTLKKVDKALAYIVLSPLNNGDIIYFESENSLMDGSVYQIN